MHIPFDPDALDRLPYPVEPLRHWYVTPFGGTSSDLEPGQIGIHLRALSENTDLEPFADRVFVTDGSAHRPLVFKEFHTVVAIDENRPDALSKSMLGEAVLPPQPTATLKGLEAPPLPGTGAPLILNAVLCRVAARGGLYLSDGALERFQSEVARVLMELDRGGGS